MFNDDFERSEDDHRKYTLVDLLIVIVYVYSLIGKDCFYGIEEENRIKVRVAEIPIASNFLIRMSHLIR